MHGQAEEAEPDEKHLGEVEGLGTRGFVGFVLWTGEIDAVFEHDEASGNDPGDDE